MASKRVLLKEIVRFAEESLLKVGSPQHITPEVAEVILDAEVKYRTYGLNLLKSFVGDIESKACDPHSYPHVISDEGSTAWVCGNNGMGPVVGNYCMKLAIVKAKMNGVGWVLAFQSNHFGLASWYSSQAINARMMGICCTNSSPIMSPTRTKFALLGENAISVAVPGLTENIILDMGLTATTLSEVKRYSDEGKDLPTGWAQCPNGRETTDAYLAWKTRCLMPLGGNERDSGYKGFGLALAIEAMTGIASGSNYSSYIWQIPTELRPANLGHCFVAIDVKECFANGYEERIDNLINTMRNLPPKSDYKPVMVPGERENKNKLKAEKENSICYTSDEIKQFDELAEQLYISRIETC